jgi:hypothetical protein
MTRIAFVDAVTLSNGPVDDLIGKNKKLEKRCNFLAFCSYRSWEGNRASLDDHLEVRRASLERDSLLCAFLEIAIESLVEENGVVTANSSKT